MLEKEYNKIQVLKYNLKKYRQPSFEKNLNQNRHAINFLTRSFFKETSCKAIKKSVSELPGIRFLIESHKLNNFSLNR